MLISYWDNQDQSTDLPVNPNKVFRRYDLAFKWEEIHNYFTDSGVNLASVNDLYAIIASMNLPLLGLASKQATYSMLGAKRILYNSYKDIEANDSLYYICSLSQYIDRYLISIMPCPYFKVVTEDNTHWVYVACKDNEYYLAIEPMFTNYSKIDRYVLHTAFAPYHKKRIKVSTPNLKYLIYDIDLFLECLESIDFSSYIKT